MNNKEDLEEELIIISYLYLKIKKSRKRRHRFWARDIFKNRGAQGAHHLYSEMNLCGCDLFENYFRMSESTFDHLLMLVGPSISKLHWSRIPVAETTRLALTLRYLAIGESMTSISYSYRIGKQTVSHIISNTLECIWKNLNALVLSPPNQVTWQKIADEFWTKWNIPNCVGALDGKHIVLEAPPKSGSEFYNYKGQHSIILLAMCDANYHFTLVDIGASGRQSDGGVLKNSNIGKNIENDQMNFPPDNGVENGPVLPFFIVADEAFPLTKRIMRPYPRNRNSVLSLDKRIFNYRLSRARRTIENAFGILVAKWRIFRRPINTSSPVTIKITQATICLHNFIKSAEDKLPASKRVHASALINSENQDGLWRQDTNNVFKNITRCGSNVYSQTAAGIRNKLKDFFNGEGAVPWQMEKALNCTY